MEQNTIDEGKTMAIISHLTLIGTIVAFFMNKDIKNTFASFYIRQMLGIFAIGIIISIVSRFANLGMIGSILGLIPLVLWIISLIGAIQGKESKVPVLGDMFQEWFKGIG